MRNHWSLFDSVIKLLIVGEYYNVYYINHYGNCCNARDHTSIDMDNIFPSNSAKCISLSSSTYTMQRTSWSKTFVQYSKTKTICQIRFLYIARQYDSYKESWFKNAIIPCKEEASFVVEDELGSPRTCMPECMFGVVRTARVTLYLSLLCCYSPPLSFFWLSRLDPLNVVRSHSRSLQNAY